MNPDLRRERRLLALLTAMCFTNVVDFMIMVPLAPQLMRVFAISAGQFALLVSVYAFAAALSSLLMASLADRYDRKTTLLVIYAGLMTATLGCALAPSYEWLLLARTVAGMFGGVVGAVALTIVGDQVPDARRGRAMAVVMMSFSLATVFGVPLSIYVAARSGWQWPFACLAACCALLWLWGWRGLPSMRGHLTRGHLGGLLQGYLELLRVPNHGWALGLAALLPMSGMMVIPYISQHLVVSGGVREADVFYIYLCGGVASLLTRPLFGWLTDRFPRPAVYYWLALAAALPIVGVTQTAGLGFAGQLMVTTLFFIFVSGRFVPAMAMITAATVSQQRGRLMSFSSGVQNLAAGLAALIAGAMVTTGSDGRLLGYEALGYLGALVGVGSIALAYRIRVVS